METEKLKREELQSLKSDLRYLNTELYYHLLKSGRLTQKEERELNPNRMEEEKVTEKKNEKEEEEGEVTEKKDEEEGEVTQEEEVAEAEERKGIKWKKVAMVTATYGLWLWLNL